MLRKVIQRILVLVANENGGNQEVRLRTWWFKGCLLGTILLLFIISEYIQIYRMPKIRRSRKPPPEGWELIEPTLEVFTLSFKDSKF